MEACVDKLTAYLDSVTENGPQEINTKSIISGFTIDVIASTTFATDTNANGKDRQNDFVKHATNFFNVKPLKILVMSSLPGWASEALGLTIPFPEDAFNFIKDLTQNIVRTRKAGGSDDKVNKRADLVQLLLAAEIDEEELSNVNYDKLVASNDDDVEVDHQSVHSSSPVTKQKQLTETEIVAQCIIFFIAGFETTASTITYTLFELANNPDIQDKLYNELQRALAERFDDHDVSDSNEYFETVMNKIPYLEAVIKETLRKYPPVLSLSRLVSKQGYKLGSLTLDKGQLIQVNSFAVHYDPEFYPDPEAYKPERFMPENKDKLNPYAYIPFGVGPRNCIGMRFAYQEIKLCLAKIVRRYRVSASLNTPAKLSFRKGIPLLMPENTLINIERR